MKLKSLNSFFYQFYTRYNEGADYIDLHMHTNHSDGYINCRTLAKFLRDKNHLIAVTDHNSIDGNMILRRLGINVVPALELGCIDGFELLVYFETEDDMVYFYKSYVLPHKNKYRMAKTYEDVHYYLRALEKIKCYISIPHIAGMAQKNYIKNKDYILNIIARVNAIEIHNDTLPKARNDIAKNLQQKYNKEITFGSDAHFMKELISFYETLKNTREVNLFKDYTDKAKLIGWLGSRHLAYGIKGVMEVK